MAVPTFSVLGYIKEGISALKGVRRKVVSIKDFLADAQIDRIKRELRMLYSYQDGMLGMIDAVVDTEGKKAEPIRNLRAHMKKSEKSVDAAIEFLRSDDVQDNLRLDLHVLSSIRGGLYTKARSRAGLLGLLHGKSRLDARELKVLMEARAGLSDLNEQIGELDKALSKSGLQVAEGASPPPPSG